MTGSASPCSPCRRGACCGLLDPVGGGPRLLVDRRADHAAGLNDCGRADALALQHAIGELATTAVEHTHLDSPIRAGLGHRPPRQ